MKKRRSLIKTYSPVSRNKKDEEAQRDALDKMYRDVSKDADEIVSN